ncbi:antitoxin [Inquilinus limosus]|uniref:AbrB family transcriptional regulator n=1 Tax=Inquilinus limosus TaxID=171674 RepID=A0A211ZQF6_9PROT|nr:AbrB family transcriptional regulator [Inquilinus limosus]OWJ67512.1 AbrB family transcriptional regulator [Inquilinus limosus]
MSKTRVLKLLGTDAGQIVRLPADFRFNGDTVYASRDARTGDVTLSERPGADSWKQFFELMRTIDVPDDFMTERPMNALPRDEIFPK